MLRRKGRAPALVSLDELDAAADEADADAALDQERVMERLLRLIQRLPPLDRQIILLYLEGMDAAAIGEITAVSARNVATKVHRIKAILGRRFHEKGGRDDD